MDEILLEEQVVEFGLDSEESTEYVGVVAGNKGFEVGSTYVVVWDGVAYESKCVDIQGTPVIGNTSAFTGIPSELPFFIYHDASDAENPVYIFATEDTAETHTIEVYSGTIEEEIPEDNTGVTITLYDRTGAAVNYDNVETITTDTPDAEQGATFTYGVAVENAEYEPNFADGNQKVTLEKGQLLKEFTLVKPETLLPEYIKKNVEVAGVIGEFAGDEAEKTVELNMAEGDQIIEADEDTVLTKVTVMKPETLSPENVVKGINIGGVIGEHVGEFGIYAGGGNNREWIEPEKIPPYMFYSNSTLTYESFPNASYVGSNAFAYASVISVDLPTCKFVSVYGFNSCAKLADVSLPKCGQLYGAVFQSCSAMKKIDLPQCMSVGNNAFKNCYNLVEISLPECAYVGDSAFQGCSKLAEVSLPSCKAIGGNAFSGCSLLEKLYAPSCSSISTTTFRSCSGLCDITLGDGVILLSNMLLNAIANNKILTISGKMTISTAAFSSCKMSGLSLLDYKTTYPSTFTNCKSLRQAYLATNVAWTYQFSNCTSLKRVIAPNIKSIAQYAFQYCSSLECFSGYYLSHLSKGAFWGCSKLSVVMLTSYSKLTSVISDAFKSTPITDSAYLGYFGSIYVPESLIASYLADTNWGWWSSRFAVITPEIETLCEWEDL